MALVLYLYYLESREEQYTALSTISVNTSRFSLYLIQMHSAEPIAVPRKNEMF